MGLWNSQPPRDNPKEGGTTRLNLVLTAGETVLPFCIMTTPLINNEDFIALDTETGGLNAAECALLSIACQPSWGAAPFVVHVLPVGRVDAKAAEMNGYSAEEWARRGAVPPKMAMLELRWWLMAVTATRFTELHNPMWRCDMAAHNAGFDVLFILAAMQRTGVDPELPKVWHCTKIGMQEARWAGLIAEEEKDNHLDDLGRVSGFWDLEPRAQAHDALQDARACAHGLKWLRGLNDGRKEAQKIEKKEGGQ